MWVLTFVVLIITWVFHPSAGVDLEVESLVYKVATAARQYDDNDLDVCITQLIHTAAAVENQTGWAIQMSEASGIPESGIYFNNVFWPASSYDCLTMSSNAKERPPFPVAYFLLESGRDDPFVVKVSEKSEKGVVLSGLCLPASCSPAQLNLFSTSLHGNRKMKSRVPYDQTVLYFTLRYTTIVIVGLVVLGTLYERVFTRSTNTNNSSINLYDIITAFSFSKNYHKLFNMKKEDDMLLVLNGWRVFGTSVMIFTHLMAFGGLHTKMKPPEEDLFQTQIMYATTLGVDDFFITGGFLLGYNFFRDNDIRNKNIDRSKTRNLIEYLKGILKRYLRLTPVYFYSMLMCAVAYSYLAPTSSFNIKEQLDSACSQYWWTNMLYINNLYPSSEEYCMSWSYYLANDMQYYILGSMLLYFSIFNKKLSVIFGLAMCSLAGMTIAGLVIYLQFTISNEGLFKNVGIFYLAPWMRITAYLCGVLISYFYTYYSNDHFSRQPVAKTLLWMFYFSARMFNGFGLLWGGTGMWFSAFYMSGGRLLYALGDSVFIYFMVTDNIFKKLSAAMSQHIWIPLSKLSYGAYLINPLVISVSMISTEKVPLARNFHFLISAIGIIAVIFALSVSLVLFIEMPINNLVGVCFPKKSKKQNEIFYDCNIQEKNK